MDLFLDFPTLDPGMNPLLYPVSFSLCAIVVALVIVNTKRRYDFHRYDLENTEDETVGRNSEKTDYWSYHSLRSIIRGDDGGEPLRLPAMFVNLNALDVNIDRITKVAFRTGTSLRIATKSVRCVEILRRIVARAGSVMCGFMCFSVEEAAFLESEGFDDFLIPYPTVQTPDIKTATLLTLSGKTITLTVDCVEHVSILDSLVAKFCEEIGDSDLFLRVAIDLDTSYELYGIKLGAHRSNIDSVDKFKQVAKAIADSKHLTLVGVVGYEASVAGLPDSNPFTHLPSFLMRFLKRQFFNNCKKFRADISLHCAKSGDINLEFFNGSGSGNIEDACNDVSLTEVAVGSAFLQSQLFDYYASNMCQPAICFALQTTRVNSEYVCTQGGGFVASGSCSSDKFPRPFLNPMTLTHYSDEGYGEVQTPLKVKSGSRGQKDKSQIGDPILFRPAKSGEIAERFNEYVLLQDNKIVKSCKTYRGQGLSFH